jgi:hypothetical protein
VSDDFDYARETLAVNALLFAGKPRLAWQRHRELGDRLAEWIEHQPGGLLDPAGPPPGVNPLDNVRYDSRPELVQAGTLETGAQQPANGSQSNLLACSRGAHAYGPWDGFKRVCTMCGQANITPP